jgi:hypothetical protein
MSDRTRVKVAARMYETQDTMRTVMGDDYEAKAKPYRDAILYVMGRDECSALAAVTAIANETDVKSNGIAMGMLVAASVDVIEGDR